MPRKGRTAAATVKKIILGFNEAEAVMPRKGSAS